MKTREDEISAFAAKTHLSELLSEAERGGSFVICRRGKAVARLVPPEQYKHTRDWQRVIKSFRDLPQRIAKKSGQIKVKELIEEGRRF